MACQVSEPGRYFRLDSRQRRLGKSTVHTTHTGSDVNDMLTRSPFQASIGSTPSRDQETAEGTGSWWQSLLQPFNNFISSARQALVGPVPEIAIVTLRMCYNSCRDKNKEQMRDFWQKGREIWYVCCNSSGFSCLFPTSRLCVRKLLQNVRER